MIIGLHLGDVVINIEDHTKHEVTQIETDTLDCGCIWTVSVKVDGNDKWYESDDFKLFDKKNL